MRTSFDSSIKRIEKLKKKTYLLRKISAVKAEMFVLSKAEKNREGLSDQAEIECLAGKLSAEKENRSFLHSQLFCLQSFCSADQTI